MVRLNKHALTDSQLETLFDQLHQTLGKLQEHEANAFLSALLGKEERIMLAKRLAIIILLVEGRSLYAIAQSLKVSPSTAEKLKRQLERNQFDSVLTLLRKNKKSYVTILETLDTILHLGGILPHYNGLDRYKHLN